MRNIFGVLCALLPLALASPALSEPQGTTPGFTEHDVPEALKPWLPWALAGWKENLCPFLYNNIGARHCVWPGSLALKLAAGGGEFTQRVTVYDEAWVGLPGNAERWPQRVRIDGQGAVVSEKGGRPGLFLMPGHYAITGGFDWDALPEMLPLPQESGVLTLEIGGQAVALPEIDAGNTLWIRRNTVAPRDEVNRLETKIFRKVTDGIPLLLETRLMLHVAGKHREEVLGAVLPEGFVPMEVESQLPARIEPDGRLRMQLRPGQWSVTLRARRMEPVTELALPKAEDIPAKEEIWSFEAQSHLRLAQVEDVPAVDPAQTEMPGEWMGLPAYHMTAESRMALAEKQRGDSAPAPDQLHLTREWWLDFDGQGYTVRDVMRGTISRSSRLEALPEQKLGRVAINGRDQFITVIETPEGQSGVGVEIRQGPLNLEADGRIESARRSALMATGWNHDVQSLRGTLHLPPGWRLFHASGADGVSDTWVKRWTLLDIFLVLIAAIVLFKLMGAATAAAGGIALVLLHHELPSLTGSALFILAAIALLRVLPEGRFRRSVNILRVIALLALLFAALPFMVLHLREAMYPQLKYAMADIGNVAQGKVHPRAVPPPPSPPPPLEFEEEKEALMDSLASRAKSRIGSMGSSADYAASPPPAPQQEIYQYDPNMKSNTGYGVSNWQGHGVEFSWNGPVDRAQTLGLWMLSPPQNLLLAFLRVLLLAFVLLFLFGTPLSRRMWREVKQMPLAGFRLMLLAGLCVWLPGVGAARAEGEGYPTPAMLEEMKKRITEERTKPPRCLPECVAVPRAKLEIAPDRLAIALEIHADAPVAVPLPGALSSWRPQSVTVDGVAATALRADNSGFLQVRLDKGAHQVEMSGPLPQAQDTVNLSFPLRVHHLSASGGGWDVQGIRENGISDSSIQLVYGGKRQREAGAREETLEKAPLPAFVEIERVLSFGISWQAVTTVRRLTPPGEAVVVEIPLLEGEAVTSADVPVKHGRAYVNLSPQAMEKTWISQLDQRDALILRAPKTEEWPEFVGVSETWRLNVSSLWHVAHEGIPPVRLPVVSAQTYTNAGQMVEMPSFKPWPGESLTVHAFRPKGVEGQTITIDNSRLEVKPGQRALEATLSLSLRSSQGGQHTIALPSDAELVQAHVNGNPTPLQLKDGAITFPLSPGSQQIHLIWNQPQGIARRFVAPPVNVNLPTVNAETVVTLPADRWVLFAFGPRMGPAVLFWSWIPVILLASFALWRIKLAPLKMWQWFLLLLGLSQTDLATNAVVAGWLLVLGWRARHPGENMGRFAFNFRQVILGLWTVISIQCLFDGIRRGLLGSPDMKIAGNGSYGGLLQWYQDITGPLLPQPWVLSLDIMAYRLLMLVWALWLAFALVRWLQWGWKAFSEGGLWRGMRLRKKDSPAPASAQEPEVS